MTFCHKFINEKQAIEIFKNNIVYPAYVHGNIIVSFQKNINYYLNEYGYEVEPSEIIMKQTEDAFNWYENDEFPTYHDFRRLLVRLINTCFEMYLKDKDLLSYELSNSTCFFFEHNEEERVKGSFYVGEKKHTIGITGKFYDDFWHYGVSFKTLLNPELCISLKNHIIFTEDGKKVWSDKNRMHSARRNKGKRMYNKEWRNQMLAFLSVLANNEDSIMSIIASESETIELSSTPILFNANYGYIEPNDEERLIPIDSYLDEIDYYDELDNATEDA